jgi:hypothetical protein
MRAARLFSYVLKEVRAMYKKTRWLYTSSAWRKTREAYIASQFGLCECCGRPGDFLHHKEHLTPDNINDHEIAFGWDNLELLCHYRHNTKHLGSIDVIGEGLVFNAEPERREPTHTNENI